MLIADIIIKIFMIQEHLIQLLCDFRRTQSDKNFTVSTAFSICDSIYNTSLHAFLQIVQSLGVLNATKFMAKKYLDIFLCAQQEKSDQKYWLLALTCLRTAIKFNQVANKSDIFSLDYCIQLSGGIYTIKQFIECENQLIKILDFKLRLTTPYDFIIVKDLMPNQKKVMSLLESVIDFTISIIDVRCYGSQEIFFGSLLYCCREKQANQICFNIIKAATFKWEESVKVSNIVESKLNQLLQQ